VAERAMYWGDGAAWMKPGYDVSPGATAADTVSHFAYASTLDGDQAFLSLINPAASCVPVVRCQSEVTVIAYSRSGMRLGTTSSQVRAGSRATISLSNQFAHSVFSLSIRASIPVVAELAQYVGGGPAIGDHPGFDELGSRGNTELSASGFEAGTAPILIRVFNPTGSHIVVRVTGLQSKPTPVFTQTDVVAGYTSLELAFPTVPASKPAASGQVQTQPLAVTVACSGLCVATGLEGARGAIIPLPANSSAEVWGGALG
jgi:hypothetical protein